MNSLPPPPQAAQRPPMQLDFEAIKRKLQFDTEQSVDVKGLPDIVDAAGFVKKEQQIPPQIIAGILHQGCKLALGGGSKTFKTWTLLDLALSVSHGLPWFGFNTTRARVCYINFELPDWSLQDRLVAVAEAKQIAIEPERFKLWNLRGHVASFDKLLPQLAVELQGEDYGLLILDPIYKIYGDTDENSAKDTTKIMNAFEHLAQEVKAAIAFASHFSKGNQAGKEAIDRISGSGVFARDPDAILTLTRHEQYGAFTVDSTLRNCRAVPPFVVRWDYPLMRKDGQLDPARLKQSKGGRPSSTTVQMIVDCLGKRKLGSDEWQKQCEKEKGISRPTFYRLRLQAQKSGTIIKDSKGNWLVSQVSKVSKPSSDT